jgi:hypothetical protein
MQLATHTSHTRAGTSGTPQLGRKTKFAVAGHCYSATAIHGQLAREMLQDFVENSEGEILTLR